LGIDSETRTFYISADCAPAELLWFIQVIGHSKLGFFKQTTDYRLNFIGNDLSNNSFSVPGFDCHIVAFHHEIFEKT